MLLVNFLLSTSLTETMLTRISKKTREFVFLTIYRILQHKVVKTYTWKQHFRQVVSNKYLQFPAQINVSLQTRTKNSVIPETSDFVFPINICNLVLYQTGNSRNTANFLLQHFRQWISNELATFGLFNVFVKETTGETEGRSTTKMFVPCCQIPATREISRCGTKPWK